MPRSNRQMIKNLQNAINTKFGEQLLYNKSQFYSESKDHPITIYSIKKAVRDEAKNRNKNVELFSTASQIQCVLFLRDYWFYLNEWEIPLDNDYWNTARKAYFTGHNSPAKVIYN